MTRRYARAVQVMAEFGIEILQGRHQVRQVLPGTLEDWGEWLESEFRECLHELYDELVCLDERIKGLDHKIDQWWEMYDHERPHSNLGYNIPQEFAESYRNQEKIQANLSQNFA